MKKNIKKILIILLVILLPIFIYLLVDWKKLYIDLYNFWQLQKVKFILKDLKREDEQFFYLKDFNEIYNKNIQPIKNCYYLRNYKSDDRVSYTFWFKLESEIFKNIYKTEYYAYPKYDLPVQSICMWWHWFCEDEVEKDSDIPYAKNCKFNWECFDTNRRAFENIVSEPCKN